MPSQGYVSDQVRENAAQSEALCRELGDTPRLLSALHRRWTYHVLRRDRETSMALAREIRRLAGDGAADLYIALSVEALTGFYLGAFPQSRDLLARAMALYRPELYPELAERFGDHCITPFFYSAWCLWACGQPDTARRQLEETRRTLDGTASLLVSATRLFFETVLWRELREPAEVLGGVGDAHLGRLGDQRHGAVQPGLGDQRLGGGHRLRRVLQDLVQRARQRLAERGVRVQFVHESGPPTADSRA